jgi:hypothetical protein
MNALETAIYGKLAGGTALTSLLAAGSASIYNGQPPRDATLPWVTFSLASGIEQNNNVVRMQRMTYLVKGVASSVYAAGAIADAADALLHDTTLTVTGYTVFLVGRTSVVRYQERDPVGNVIGHAGGEYVVWMQTGS